MSQQKTLNLGLFGFGVVGEGIYKVLQQSPSLEATVKKICIKQKDKPRDAPADLFTTDYAELLNDASINVIVELIDDADEAYKIVTAALKSGKAVISANKKMIAEHLSELLHLQQLHQTSFLYEGAVAGSIPIIRNLEEYYDNDLLHSIYGIINGSTNYILTRLFEGNMSFSKALKEAQVAGFAESDPELDISGKDAANKLAILLTHAYGLHLTPGKLLTGGIKNIQEADVLYAKEKSLRIRLVARATKLKGEKIAAFVLPQFVPADNLLFGVDNEYNGLVLESRLADKQFLYGKGAGRYPTSSAVISDISALRYGYKYEYKKENSSSVPVFSHDYYLKVYVSFSSWSEVNKWDFYDIEELYSTNGRQHLIGVIHAEKLIEADWFTSPAVSVIACTDPIVQKEDLLTKSIKKISLQLAGVSL